MSNQIYNQLWARFSDAIDKNQYQTDPYIYQQEDNRRGITALAYIEANDTGLVDNIAQFYSDAKVIEANQYYYPLSELHLTILSIISCFDGFKITDIDRQHYIDVFQHALSEVQPIDIEFRGITASPSCILIQGFAQNSALTMLREKLRTEFGAPGLKSTFDTRYKQTTAHLTAIRFTQPFKDAKRFKQFCAQQRNRCFGSIRLSRIDLVFNDWYQRSSNTTSLNRHTIDD